MADGYNTQRIIYENEFSKALLYNAIDGYSYSISQFYPTVSDRLIDRGNILDIFSSDDNLYNYTQYFKLRGYHLESNSYETWTTANLPNFNPPSGNVLTDIVIVSVWFA